MISNPLVRRTRATLRSAEFGFFGVVVYTRVQTPRRCGEPFSAGVRVFTFGCLRPWRTSCWIVGTLSPRSVAPCGRPWAHSSRDRVGGTGHGHAGWDPPRHKRAHYQRFWAGVNETAHRSGSLPVLRGGETGNRGVLASNGPHIR